MAVEQSSDPRVEPFLSQVNLQEPSWFLGAQTWLRATAEQTGGAFGLIEQIIDPGFASPYHVHRSEDEAFYILQGQVRFVSADRSWLAGSGGFAFLPRDIPHGFRIEGSEAARVLILVTPGGFERFVTELSEPKPPSGPPDMEQLVQAAARFGVEILGPLPL